MIANTRTVILKISNSGIFLTAGLFAIYNTFIGQYPLAYFNTILAVVSLLSLILLKFESTRQPAFFITFSLVFFVACYSILTANNDITRLFWIWPIIIFSFCTLPLRASLIYNILILVLILILLFDPFSLGTKILNKKDLLRFVFSILLSQILFYIYEVSRTNMEKYISNLAFIETSFGIPNLNGLVNELDTRIEKEEKFSLILIQLQDYTVISSRTDYNEINSFIKKTIKLLENIKTPKNFMAKTSEDSFFLVTDKIDNDSIKAFGNTICQEFNKLANSIPELLRFKIQIGAVVNQCKPIQSSEWIRYAKIALEECRLSSSSANIHIFEESWLDRWNQKNSIVRLIHRGLKNKEFKIHYQPQYDAKSGKIVAVESLLRWHQIDSRSISTDELIETAEESDLIYALGDYAIESSLAGILEDDFAAKKNIKIAVNLTPRQLLHSNLCNQLQKFINLSNINPNQIELEISEKTLLQKSLHPMRKIKRLDKMGIRILINDFGSSVIGIRYLSGFPISAVKIDKKLIKNFHLKKSKLKLIESMVLAISSFGIDVIPEGVETIEQVKLLQKFGCSRLQGWYFSKARDLDSLKKYMDSYIPESIFESKT